MGGFNGAGIYNRFFNWVTDKSNGVNITSSRVDTEDDGFAAGLSNTICRDGQSTITADIPWTGRKITSYGSTSAPNARTDVPALGQVQDAKLNWVVAGGTADAITASYAPVITALVDGQECRFRASAANATTTPTFSPNGLTAETITKRGGAALVANDIPGALAEIILRYNLANTRWELVNATVPTGTSGHTVPFLDGNNTVSGNNTFSGASTFTGTETIQASTPRLTLDSTGIGGADAGDVTFSGLNGSSVNKNWGNINNQVTDATAGNETAQLNFSTNQAGSFTARMSLAIGMTLGGPTGGDKGAGTINASAGMYVAGVSIVPGARSIGSSGYYTLPGGLILQWGSAAVGPLGTTTGNFPIAFPASCDSIVGSYASAAPPANAPGAVAISASQYQVFNGSSANTLTINWTAYGH